MFLQVIPVINKLRHDYEDKFSLVILSQDWHCPNHVSFASQHVDATPMSQISLTYDDKGKYSSPLLSARQTSLFSGVTLNRRFATELLDHTHQGERERDFEKSSLRHQALSAITSQPQPDKRHSI